MSKEEIYKQIRWDTARGQQRTGGQHVAIMGHSVTLISDYLQVEITVDSKKSQHANRKIALAMFDVAYEMSDFAEAERKAQWLIDREKFRQDVQEHPEKYEMVAIQWPI